MQSAHKIHLFARPVPVFIILLALFLGGCAPQAQLDMLDRNVSGLQIETHRIGQEVETLKKRMVEVEGQSGENGRKSVARLNARIDGLESELMRLNGLVDQLKYNQEREETELAQLKEEIQSSLERVGKMSPAVQPGVSTVSPRGAKSATVQEEVQVQEPKPAARPEDLYREGLKLFKMQKYQEAKSAFRDFIKQHPGSPMVANAHFWIGECEYKRSRYEEAILEYNKVINKFPKSNKVPDALLKQGFAFAKLGDKESARILLKRLIKSFPTTPQAKAAKRQLKLLR